MLTDRLYGCRQLMNKNRKRKLTKKEIILGEGKRIQYSRRIVFTWWRDIKWDPFICNTAQFLLPSDGGNLYPSFPVNHSGPINYRPWVPFNTWQLVMERERTLGWHQVILFSWFDEKKNECYCFGGSTGYESEIVSTQ